MTKRTGNGAKARARAQTRGSRIPRWPASRPVRPGTLSPETQSSAAPLRMLLARTAASPPIIAAIVLIWHAAWLAYFLPHSHEGRDFIFIGRRFVRASQVSTTIRVDAHYIGLTDRTGYDGQFCYYIALDPVHARYYIDRPVYRYTRIVYPLSARAIAVGQPTLIPYTLILVNWLAIGGATLAVAAWLRRRGITPAWALLFGIYPGFEIALSLDLTEPLAYALAALGIYLLDAGGRFRLAWSAGAFALAALTRETTAIFPALYGLALLVRSDPIADRPARLLKNLPRTALFLGIAIGPLLLYKLFLQLWLGSAGIPSEFSLLQIPFSGVSSQPGYIWNTNAERSVIVPALICTGMALWAIAKGERSVEIWILLVNVEVCVLGLSTNSYDPFEAPARIATGVTLAAFCCIPLFDRVTRRNRIWLIVCALLWIWLDVDWLRVLPQIYPS